MVSIIIPVKKINDYIRHEVIPALKKQSFKNFELIIVPDKIGKKEKFPSFVNPAPGTDIYNTKVRHFRFLFDKTSKEPSLKHWCGVKIVPSWPKKGPADKRDLGVKKARAEIIAFLDDDASPHKNWLKNAIPYFKNPQIAAVCGPGVTPPSDNLRQKISGWVWSTWLGAGSNTFRCSPRRKREIDDYPTFNLFVRKSDFQKVGGFDSHFWPGEDTKLCHDLVYKLRKKIIYDPKILVFHHRREIFIPHLKQISRFGLHRGFFIKILPKTSKRIGYFMPLFFLLWLFLTPPLIFILEIFQLCAISIPLLFLYLFSIFIYLFLLLTTSLQVWQKEKAVKLALLLIPAIVATHLVYGLMFAKGLLTKKLRQ